MPKSTFLRPYTGNVYVPDLGGVPPEAIAFAMSRFSRSANDLATSLRKVLGYPVDKQTSFFLENYHGYGHASIADQAPIVFAIQNVSMLAIFIIWQMLQLVAGQERSSRYQPFETTGFSFFENPGDSTEITAMCDLGFSNYLELHRALVESFRTRYPDERFKDEGGWMSKEVYAQKIKKPLEQISDKELLKANQKQAEAIRRARAFDIARYLLCFGTNTNACFLMSARSVERLITQLLVHELPELKFIGQELLNNLTAGDAPLAPTMLKYAKPNRLITKRRDSLMEIRDQLGLNQPIIPIARTSAQVIIPDTKNPILNIAARLLYPHCTCDWQSVFKRLRRCSTTYLEGIIDAGGWQRAIKEDFPRDARGSELTVEFVMDAGAARDLNRHRACWKQYQWLTLGPLGWDMGDCSEVQAAGFEQVFTETCNAMCHTGNIYTVPLAGLIRAVYHMNWNQFIYMTELRSAPSGHFAYRYLTKLMVDSLSAACPLMYNHLIPRIGPGQFRFTKYELDNFFVR